MPRHWYPILLAALFALPVPTLAQADGWEVTFTESFDDNRNAWDVGRDRREETAIAEGLYKIRVRSSDTWHWFTIPLDIYPERTSALIASLRKTGGSSDHNWIGLVWGARDNNNLCAFLIDPDAGEYAVLKVENGAFTWLVDWRYDVYVRRGRESNVLGVVFENGNVFLSLNDRASHVAAFSQAALPFRGNLTGFFAGPRQELEVDGLLMQEYTPPPSIIAEDPPPQPASREEPARAGRWAGNGSGVIVSREGHIVTNYHVVAGNRGVEVDVMRNGRPHSYRATVVLEDPANDLALLQIDDPAFERLPTPPFALGADIRDPGSPVFTLGYPLALDLLGEEVKFTEGAISARTGFRGDIATYQISVPVQPGNSGGPLFDYAGNLIGIVNARVDGADNVSYAIKAGYVQSLLEALPAPPRLPTHSALAGLPVPSQVRTLTAYTALIKVR